MDQQRNKFPVPQGVVVSAVCPGGFDESGKLLCGDPQLRQRVLHVLGNEAQVGPAGPSVRQLVADGPQPVKQRAVAVQSILDVLFPVPVRRVDDVVLRIDVCPVQAACTQTVSPGAVG